MSQLSSSPFSPASRGGSLSHGSQAGTGRTRQAPSTPVGTASSNDGLEPFPPADFPDAPASNADDWESGLIDPDRAVMTFGMLDPFDAGPWGPPRPSNPSLSPHANSFTPATSAAGSETSLISPFAATHSSATTPSLYTGEIPLLTWEDALTPKPGRISYTELLSSCISSGYLNTDGEFNDARTRSHFGPNWIELVSSGYITRFIKIGNIRPDANIDYLNSNFTHPAFRVPNLVVLSQLRTNGTIYAYFSDVRDACVAFANLTTDHPGWSVGFVGKNRFVDTLGLEHKFHSFSEVCVTMTFFERQFSSLPDDALSTIQAFMGTLGEYHSFKVVRAKYPCLSVHAAFFDNEEAQRARDLEELRFGGASYVAGAIDMEHDPHRRPPRRGQVNLLSTYPMGHRDRAAAPEDGHWPDFDPWDDRPGSSVLPVPWKSSEVTCTRPRPCQPSPCQPSPYQPRQCLPPSPGLAQVSTPRRVCSRVDRHCNPFPSVHHNVVDIDRIAQGVDVRTTIMLRNIPNKITQSMLKEIVDETSLGKYDFMYLRIDFANNCNVGYAFINFEDPWDIINFVKARAGKRWNCYNSDKVAEVSYATIQGKDCLVQKFRNSSVMMEHPTFRPKIFRTGYGLDAGQEEPFPEPDNASKMRRSLENAEHVGLFAPRAGQQVRDEQRRRRSTFDRGSRYAQLEYPMRPERNVFAAGYAF